jgi:hypothetical protein
MFGVRVMASAISTEDPTGGRTAEVVCAPPPPCGTITSPRPARRTQEAVVAKNSLPFAEARGDDLAIADEFASVTFVQVNERVNRAVHALQSFELGQGDRRPSNRHSVD